MNSRINQQVRNSDITRKAAFMDYKQLSAEYNKLLEENAVLKKENTELRKLLLLPEQKELTY